MTRLGRWIRSSLRKKLAVAMIVTSLVPLSVAGVVGVRVILGRLERGLRERSAQTSRIALNLLLRRVQRVSDDARGLAAAPELHEALALQPALAQRFLLRRVWALAPGIVDIFDAKGRFVASTGRVRRDGRASRKKGSKTVTLGRTLDLEFRVNLETLGKKLAIRAVAPVVDSEFVLRGALRITLPLDDTLADYLKGVLRAEVAFVGRGGYVGGTTFRVHENALRHLGGVVMGPPSVRRVGEREFALASAPLQTVSGERVGFLLVGLDRRSYLQARVNALHTLGVAFAVALLMALLGAAVVGRRITTPLAGLHRGILAMKAGDRGQTLAIDAHDE
ncbi:MAG: hypothetical protein KAI47_04325, partial [Deltaproteobacteria bacterium]|nr:hypothetical protein [Deltaproteobacteria bacterium]